MSVRLAALIVAMTSTASGAEPMPNLKEAERLIADQTNAFRKKEGHEPVKSNPKLTKTAADFAQFMAETTEYGHEADGNTPAERAEKHEYDYCIVLENIAYVFDPAGYTTVRLGTKFVTGWKESPGHRKNMLDPDVTETGVAIALSEKNGHYYAVQMFGRPKSAAITFKITNKVGEAVKYKVGETEYDLPPRLIRTHNLCRPTDVVFDTPADDNPTVRPKDGDEFTFHIVDGKVTLTADMGK